jgi:hypothetical protein
MRSEDGMKRWVLLIALLCAARAGVAQAPPAPAPASAGSPTTSGTEEAKKAAPVKNPDAPPPKPAAAKGSPQRFEPSERVRPDFDVAFPVDI